MASYYNSHTDPEGGIVDADNEDELNDCVDGNGSAFISTLMPSLSISDT